MVFAFLFGLSMDYEVFILARMREEYDAHRLDRRRGRARDRAHRPAGHERGVDPVPGVRRRWRPAPDTDVKMLATGLGGRDPVRRDRDPGAARARGGVAVRPLELVAARAAGALVAREALPAGGGGSRRPLTRRAGLTSATGASRGIGAAAARALRDTPGMSSEAAALVQLFNDRWNGHDLYGVLACIDDEMEFDWSD